MKFLSRPDGRVRTEESWLWGSFCLSTFRKMVLLLSTGYSQTGLDVSPCNLMNGCLNFFFTLSHHQLLQ